MSRPGYSFLFQRFGRVRAILRRRENAFSQFGLDLGAGQHGSGAAGDILLRDRRS